METKEKDGPQQANYAGQNKFKDGNFCLYAQNGQRIALTSS